MQMRLVRYLLTLVWRELGVELGIVAMVEQLYVSIPLAVMPAHAGKDDGANSQECLVPLSDVVDGSKLGLGREGQLPWLAGCVSHEGLEVQ